MKTIHLFWFLFIVSFCSGVQAQDQLTLPAEIREWFRNPDGSCVQCSIGMAGVWQNNANAQTLLWDTEYGPRVRGGSSPSRVADYCNRRGIKAYNVTGSNTWDWMAWCARNGRMAAIGAGGSHFQTLCWWDQASGFWYVCNNNSPQKIDKYDWNSFQRLHLASGQWVVILDTPAPPVAPRYVQWWK